MRGNSGFMIRGILAAVGAVLALTTAPVQAQSNTVVVELFTSQGCSSCPPVDELLRALSERDDVIALALHVDYWDYIGWKDSFANPAHTKRQKAYAYAAGQRTIYTPQVIVGGKDHVVGYEPMRLAKLIQDHIMGGFEISMSVTRTGEGMLIEATAPANPMDGIVVQLVRYMPEATVDIRRGENAGLTMSYSNIVTDWSVLGNWDGASPLSLTADVSGDEPLVVVLQRTGHGPILAAARLQ